MAKYLIGTTIHGWRLVGRTPARAGQPPKVSISCSTCGYTRNDYQYSTWVASRARACEFCTKVPPSEHLQNKVTLLINKYGSSGAYQAPLERVLEGLDAKTLRSIQLGDIQLYSGRMQNAGTQLGRFEQINIDVAPYLSAKGYVPTVVPVTLPLPTPQEPLYAAEYPAPKHDNWVIIRTAHKRFFEIPDLPEYALGEPMPPAVEEVYNLPAFKGATNLRVEPYKPEEGLVYMTFEPKQAYVAPALSKEEKAADEAETAERLKTLHEMVTEGLAYYELTWGYGLKYKGGWVKTAYRHFFETWEEVDSFQQRLFQRTGTFPEWSYAEPYKVDDTSVKQIERGGINSKKPSIYLTVQAHRGDDSDLDDPLKLNRDADFKAGDALAYAMSKGLASRKFENGGFSRCILHTQKGRVVL